MRLNVHNSCLCIKQCFRFNVKCYVDTTLCFCYTTPTWLELEKCFCLKYLFLSPQTQLETRLLNVCVMTHTDLNVVVGLLELYSAAQRCLL